MSGNDRVPTSGVCVDHLSDRVGLAAFLKQRSDTATDPLAHRHLSVGLKPGLPLSGDGIACYGGLTFLRLTFDFPECRHRFVNPPELIGQPVALATKQGQSVVKVMRHGGDCTISAKPGPHT
jgi:hypothetical protein